MQKEEYRSCMTKNMGGGRLKGLSKEDRRIEFCAIAKQCSRDISYEEARKLCLLPKEPKLATKRGTRSRKYAIDSSTLATCVFKSLDDSEITLANLTTIIANCTGQKIEKPLTRERFIKKCFKENSIIGDIKEAQKLRSLCTAKWKEQELAT